MNLIIETDLGHDPDDFFAICYLVSAGVNIRAILITPGDPDQIAIARFICQRLGLDIPIGASKLNRTKLSSGSIHHKLLKKYDCSLESKPDGLGSEIFGETLKRYPDAEIFAIGPVSSIGRYLKEHPETEIGRATMQGGFLPYSLYRPKVVLEKFEVDWIPTFNMNGDSNATKRFLAANIKERRFVGKNVCHTIVYSIDDYLKMKFPFDEASWLFNEGMNTYLAEHDSKKFHDPTAAICHLHPEIGKWVRGRPKRIQNGWTTEPDENGDYVLADIDREKLWEHIYNHS
jgi:inosine-uridine nucleoside N-ribohydrolase